MLTWYLRYNVFVVKENKGDWNLDIYKLYNFCIYLFLNCVDLSGKYGINSCKNNETMKQNIE